jgi:hypothetical protein
MSSVTVAVDGTLFRHHDKFKSNLIRTLSRLVPRTVSFSRTSLSVYIFESLFQHRLVLSEDGSSKGSALVAAVDRRLKTTVTYEKTFPS